MSEKRAGAKPAGTIRRRIRTTGWLALLALVLAIVAFVVWTQIVMAGDRRATIEVFDNAAVQVTDTGDSIVMTPTGEDGGADASGEGLVFIPGAKVDPYAYLYKLSGAVEESGLTVVITKPTLNLAFFDQRPLSTFTEAAPGVTDWFVGGHSLGGVRACQWADSEDVAGLVLFGSYCANDLSQSGLPVLSIGGSNDGLSTPAKIEDASGRLPANTEFVELDGANHADFGDYGVQPGDGTSTVSDEDVRAEITDAIDAFVG
jgi:hypothetical protein